MNELNDELASILKTANLYIDGVHNGDVEMLKSAFHPKAMMYGSSDNNNTIIEIEGLYSYVAANDAPVKTGEAHQCFITGIRYAGNAAIIEMVEESAHGFDYTNYFQLLKIDGTWLIVSKAYNAAPHKV